MYTFAAGSDRLDRTLVHHWLSVESYWARGRSRATQDAAIEASRNYGVYDDATDRQIAYARVITDGATFAWLCDVFVDDTARGAGIGKMLMAGVMADLEPLGLKRVMLATADAHGLYAQYGFAPLADSTKWMATTREA